MTGHLNRPAVSAFLRAVFGPDRLLEGWSFAAVVPDFLPSTEYHTGKPSPALASFDGGGSDTATLAYRDDVSVLLLTNGSP